MKKWIFNLLFEKTPIVKWLNGHKTTISRAFMVISALLAALQQWFPEYAPIPVSVFNAQGALLLSFLGIEIGTMHKEVKDGR